MSNNLFTLPSAVAKDGILADREDPRRSSGASPPLAHQGMGSQGRPAWGTATRWVSTMPSETLPLA